MKFEKNKLKEISSYVTDRIKTEEVTEDNYISTENMLANKEGKVSASKLPNSKTVLAYKQGDILISNIRPYFRKIWFSNDIGGSSADVLVIRPNEKVLPSYLYYILSQDKIFEYMVQTSKGTKMPRGDKKALMNYELEIPTLDVQKNISSFLSNIDKKIDINNYITSNLEELAQTLFNRWFVDFEFPNGDGQPYKSSGGKMIESELGMIPEGWEIKTLKELTSRIRTGLNPRKNFKLGEGNNYYVTIKNMSNNQVILNDRCDRITSEAIQIINKRSDLQKGDLLFSGIGTIGRVHLISKTPENWNISESIFTLRNNENVTSELLYLILLSCDLQNYTIQLSSGSVQKGIRKRDLERYKLALPNNECIEQFTLKISNIIKKTQLLFEENQNLKNIRDTLLPRLLSGEIELPDSLEVTNDVPIS